MVSPSLVHGYIFAKKLCRICIVYTEIFKRSCKKGLFVFRRQRSWHPLSADLVITQHVCNDMNNAWYLQTINYLSDIQSQICLCHVLDMLSSVHVSTRCPEQCSSSVDSLPRWNSANHLCMVVNEGASSPKRHLLSTEIWFRVKSFKYKYLITARFSFCPCLRWRLLGRRQVRQLMRCPGNQNDVTCHARCFFTHSSKEVSCSANAWE